MLCIQHVVKAHIDGIIKSAEVEVGQQVSDSTVLCQIEVRTCTLSLSPSLTFFK